MKTIIKIFLIGLVAGLVYKYMVEKEIDIAEKSDVAIEWIKDKIESLSDLSAEDISNENAGSKEEVEDTGNYTGHSYSPMSTMNPASKETRPVKTHAEESKKHHDNHGVDISGAIEYRIMEKDQSNILELRSLDSYAKNTPAEYENSIPDLAEYFAGHASNDMEKARLIFTWVATHIAYDAHGFNTGYYAGSSAEEVLNNRVSVCEGYSNLLVALGNAAGIKTIKIDGSAKGIGYRYGKKTAGNNHAWNAMMVNGKWRLLDATWAAGYGKAVNGKLVSVMQFDDYWFDTAPEEFIFTHLPATAKWQLLRIPVTRACFEEMPYASSDYFKLGFNGKQCFKKVMNGSIRSLPETFSIDHRVKLISMPAQGVIKSGTAVKLRLKADNVSRVALKNNDEWLYFEKKEDEYALVTVPRKGKMKLMANFKGDGLPFHTILKYTVE